jgi:hypothetical protein
MGNALHTFWKNTGNHGGRWLVLALPAVLLFLGAMRWAGPPEVFRLWGLTVLSPDYEDARGITAAIESQNEGHDPRFVNPKDPWERKYNYPRPWLLLGHLGINQEHTAAFAAVLGAAFFIGLLAFPERSTGAVAGAGMLAIAFSPAVMLGYKAGNTDLFMFFLVAMAVLGISRSSPAARVAGCVAIAAGFVLKIFPAFALAAILGWRPRYCLPTLAVAVLLAASYAWVQRDDLAAVRNATPQAGSVSYGRLVAAVRFVEVSPVLGKVASAASWIGVAAGGLLLAGGALGRRHVSPDEAEPEVGAGLSPMSLAAFRAGAMVYCGTFLLGGNWDYRLMFLIFTVPALVSIARGNERVASRVATLTLAAEMVSCWALAIWNTLKHIPGGSPASVVLDEGANWFVFLALLWLFGRTVPSWFPVFKQARTSESGPSATPA